MTGTVASGAARRQWLVSEQGVGGAIGGVAPMAGPAGRATEDLR